MSEILTDTYWQDEFDITRDDLDRIAKRMRKNQKAYNLTELAKRLVRGRLEHGRDTSPTALPDWVSEQKVYSWNQVEDWQKDNRVLVARKDDLGNRAGC